MSDLQDTTAEHVTHTKGPWFVERMYEASRTIAIMRDFKGPNVALAVHGPQNWIHESGAAEQIAANAHLIAAAPELLEACKELRDALAGAMRVIALRGPDALADAFVAEMKRIGILDGVGVRADEAIAKAEGRPS